MKDLHLKYKMDNGIPAYTTISTDDGPMELPSGEYLAWIEELALKQLKGIMLQKDLSMFSKKELRDEMNNRNMEYLFDKDPGDAV